MARPTQRVVVYLTPAQYEALRRLSYEQRARMSELARRALVAQYGIPDDVDDEATEE